MIVARPAEFQCMSAVGESASAKAASATAELTRGMVKGEEEAFRKFYDSYSARLFGYLFVICRGNEQQARELLQETMTKVARYIRVFEQEEIFWKWLTVVARSCWVDENRKRNRYLAALERFWNWRNIDTCADESDEMLLVGSLELLAEDDRALLTQKYVDGLSVREIAEASGSSEKAVESRLTRARNRMKQLLSRKEP